MSATDFIDSNVLLYLASNHAVKAMQAGALLADGGCVSIQVLDEFASVASRKLRKEMHEIRAALLGIRAVCHVINTDIKTHELGLDIAARYKYSVYDSMLIAAALQARCKNFYTEDMQHGQTIEGLTIRNPFTS